MPRFTVRVIILVFCLFTAFNKPLKAEPNSVSAGVKPQQKSSGGYCGIYCMYGAMKLFGVNVDPNELIRPEYIGSVQGSSLAELKKCAENHGLYATPVARLSTKDLRKSSLPVIIHVKSSPTGRRYDHYELFLGSKQGQALIYDPPKFPELVEFWTLAPRWDGSGLLVSDKPVHINTVFAPARLTFVVYAAIAAAIVLAVKWGGKYLFGFRQTVSRKQTILLSFGQCAFLVLVATLGAFVYHSINDEGLLLRKQATEAIQRAYQSSFVPKTAEKKSQLTSNTK